MIGAGFALEREDRVTHMTPSGKAQSFANCVFRRV